MFSKSLFSFLFFISNFSLAGSVAVKVTLNPAGSFTAKTSEVVGSVSVVGGKVQADSIKVKLKSLKTGVELRDKHTLKRLEVEKYPEAVLKVGTGENGKGKGTIVIRGIEKEISGTYAIKGDLLVAKFKLNLPDFKIKDINYMGVGVEDEVDLLVEVPVKK